MSRFYITELRGDLSPRIGNPTKPTSFSLHILDRLANHRIVATYRTEDQHGYAITTIEREARARELAEAHLARLEA